jgi:DNA-binding CsgD family transcriptional regulator
VRTSADQVNLVIETLYDAALDEALWPKALQGLADLTGSQAATLWLLDGSDQPSLPLLTILNFDPAFMHAYLDGMVPLDPTVQYLVRHPTTPIVHDAMVISEREKESHPYYDWHGKWSDTRFRLVGQMSIAPQVQAGIALHRAKRSGRYEAPEVEQLSFLHGHLTRALTIGLRLGFVGALQGSITELLDRNPVAVLLLDEFSRLVYANRSATALPLNNDGVRLSSAGIVADNKAANDALQALISRALSSRSAAAAPAPPPQVVRIPRSSGKRPYCVFVSKLGPHQSALSSDKPAVCVIVTDPDGQRRPSMQSIQAAFGLTVAEARLAALLAAGSDLLGAAKELQITYGTARARLAQIYLKTDTRRQGELIRLLLTTLAV